MPCVGEGEVNHRRFEWGVPQGTLEEPGGHPRFQERGGVRMAQRMEGDAHVRALGPVCGGAEGALDTGATHRGSRRRTVGVLPPGGGKEPGAVPRGVPGGAEQCQRRFGEGNVPVFGALAAVDMALETRASDVGNLEAKGLVESASQAIDGRAGELVVQGSGRMEEPPDLLHTADGGETVCGVRPQEREGVPVPLEDGLREAADAAIAAAHGGWGQAIDVFAGQAGALQLLFRNPVGGLVGERREQADFTDRGCLRPCACATAVEGRKHLLT